MIETVWTAPDKSFFWLDVTDPKKRELTQLAKDHGLHANFVMDCLDPEHLPKFEKLSNVNFLILRSYDDRCSEDADEVTELTRKIAVFIGSGFLITIHRRSQRFLEDFKSRWRVPASALDPELPLPEPSSAPLLVANLLSEVFKTYEAPIEIAYSELDRIELGIVEAQNLSSGVLKAGYFLKRRASVFKRMIRLSSDAVMKLNAQYFEIQSPYAQDLKENLDSLYFYVDELVENTNNLLNLHISLSAQRTNEVMRILTVFSLFFLPLNFIASIYGMNFEHMPELKWVWGYPAAIGGMIAVAIGISVWFRKNKWL